MSNVHGVKADRAGVKSPALSALIEPMRQEFQERANFDGLAEAYLTGRPDYPHEIFDSYLKNLADKFPGQVLNLLDVACGTGAVLKNLLSTAPETKLTGIDISQDMLNHDHVRSQRLAAKPQLICGDAVDYLASHSDQYHGITLVQVWQYFRNTRFTGVAAGALKNGENYLSCKIPVWMQD